MPSLQRSMIWTYLLKPEGCSESCFFFGCTLLLTYGVLDYTDLTVKVFQMMQIVLRRHPFRVFQMMQIFLLRFTLSYSHTFCSGQAVPAPSTSTRQGEPAICCDTPATQPSACAATQHGHRRRPASAARCTTHRQQAPVSWGCTVLPQSPLCPRPTLVPLGWQASWAPSLAD